MPDNNNTTLNGPRMPYSLEAEQAVLGAVLMEPDAISRVAEVLPSSEYFYLANHRTIYAVMLSMFTSGQPVDQITVLEALKTERDFDDATGKTYLYQLAQNCPSIANVENYARIVRDKYDVRALMNAEQQEAEEYELFKTRIRAMSENNGLSAVDRCRDAVAAEILSVVVLLAGVDDEIPARS